MDSLLRPLLIFFFIVVMFGLIDGRDIYTFKMHHRFSDPVKNWISSRLNFTGNWPERGSFEYYSALAHRDRVLGRGRRLSDDADQTLVFADGNSTFRIASLGFLHYTTVELGTPGTKFMVALDTGSDLFWVPCDCRRCAPTQSLNYASDFQLSTYNPKASMTSKQVDCNNDLCTLRNRCLGAFASCPYAVSYVSADTATSGVLVEDVLRLTRESEHHKDVEAYVTFGCGQVQSGSFLDIAAPNGLFGLGMEKISVPSILLNEGLIADSFSMCFGHDGIGRISFGDKGSPDQEETPFNVNPLHPTYNITVTQIRVGTTIIDEDFTALFDSGTSFAYLVDPIYESVSTHFHSQVKDRRRQHDSRIPFEYCYDMSPEENSSLIPSMSLTFKGGKHYAIDDPVIVISTQNELVYCLAIGKSTELNIIGQNFMSGYRIVFDRERLILGWKKFNCYDVESHKVHPKEPQSSTVPPAVAAGISNNSTSESTKEKGKNNQNSKAFPTYVSSMSFLTKFVLLVFVYTVL